MFFASLGVLAVVGYRLIPAFGSAINFGLLYPIKVIHFLGLNTFFVRKLARLEMLR